jgi:hypothetical protein
MGFNKMYVPEVAVLKEDLLKRGNENFMQTWVSRYLKADAVIGSVESMDFLKQFINREYNGTEANQKATK